MLTLESFEQELRKALSRLYDPTYEPPMTFAVLLGCDPQGGASPVQAAIIREMEGLASLPGPPSSQHRRLFDVLHTRYSLQLTQDGAAERLYVSRSTVQRLQRQAVRTLARSLLSRGQAGRSKVGEPAEAEAGHEPPPLALAEDWRAQTKRELVSLHARAPDAVADVSVIIDSLLRLQNALTSGKGVRLELGSVQSGLIAAIHPSVLRQILITAVARISDHAAPSKIMIFAGLENGSARVTLVASGILEVEADRADFTRHLLAPEHVSIQTHFEDDHLFMWIELPPAGRVTVLVVEDNPDVADFYRRCTEGTNYHIVCVSQGQDLTKAVAISAPEIIVLDVMLPDVDGWELLMRLHADPATRPIPVIVCSVVREEELALSLGAAHYVMKPVTPRQFIQALDQVLA